MTFTDADWAMGLILKHQAAFKLGYYNFRWNQRLAQLGSDRMRDRRNGPPYIYTRGTDNMDWSDDEINAYELGWQAAYHEREVRHATT